MTTPTTTPAGSAGATRAARGRTLSRRLLLQLATAAASVGLAARDASPARAGDAAAHSHGWRDTFTAFCDTLVPADDWTPASSALGVPATILDAVAGSGDAERLLVAGCTWLDAACDGDFARADEPVRVAACERMQGMPWDSPPGRFFGLLRNTVLAEYYAQPRAWHGLALEHPPQPDGFFEALGNADHG